MLPLRELRFHERLQLITARGAAFVSPAALLAAVFLRLWKDTGLYAGDGRARAGLTSWRRGLERPRRP